MTKYAILKHDINVPGPVLRDMGAKMTDENGIVWGPNAGDQTISKDSPSVGLSPDPDSLRQHHAKQAKLGVGKPAFGASGPKNGPGYALQRMLGRPVTRSLMLRLQRRGLVPRAPQYCAELKKPLPKPAALKPQLTVNATMRKAINKLPIIIEYLEAIGHLAARPALKVAAATMAPGMPMPKFRGRAFNFG